MHRVDPTAQAYDLYYRNAEMEQRAHRLGEFERAILLAIVRLGDCAYGVPIRAELERRLSRTIATGAVYTTLDRLEEKGLVSSRLGEPTPERGGRAKRFYRVDASGFAALNAAKEASDAVWSLWPIPTGGKG